MNESLSDRCRGKWAGLLMGLGVDSRYLNGKHGPCPICNAGHDRFRFDDKDGRGSWICSVCGAGDGPALLMRMKGWDFKQVAEQIESIVGKVSNAPIRQQRNEASLREAMNRLWNIGVPVRIGDPVYAYLRKRGIEPHEYPKALRYVERCRYQGDTPTYWPAMVAKVTAPDGSPTTIHRTYLTDNGAKAPVGECRRLMPGKVEKGCAIRLAPAGPVLGIAEGIETAMSAAHIFGLPVWAAVSAGMLMGWIPPDGTEEVVIFADNDVGFAGQSAAFALAHRLTAGGMKVRVEMPPDVGMDWNDCLIADCQERAA